MGVQLIIFLIIGLLLGGLIAWFIAKSKFHHPQSFSAEEYGTVLNERNLLEQRFNDLRSETEIRKIDFLKSQDKISSLNIELSRLDTINKGLNEKFENQKLEIEDLHKKIKEQFENIASKIITVISSSPELNKKTTN